MWRMLWFVMGCIYMFGDLVLFFFSGYSSFEVTFFFLYYSTTVLDPNVFTWILLTMHLIKLRN